MPPNPSMRGGYGGNYGGGGGGGGYNSGAPRTRHPPRKEATNTIFLGRASNVEDNAIFENCRHHGKILRIGRMQEKGVAFIHYGTREEAESALNHIVETDCLGFEV